MFISNSRKFIYFHIPKSAGTSLTQLFVAGMAWNDLCIGGSMIGDFFQKYWTPIFKLDKHDKPARVRALIGDKLFDQYFKFAFLRDPIDRFRSASQFIVESVRGQRSWAMQAKMIQKYLPELEQFSCLSDVYNSEFFANCLEVPSGEGGDIVKLFQPQAAYFLTQTGERIDGIYCFPLSQMQESLSLLLNRGLVSQQEIDESQILARKHNVSSKLLVDDLDAAALGRLRIIYNSDYRLLENTSIGQISTH